jgi:hypothetical protein
VADKRCFITIAAQSDISSSMLPADICVRLNKNSAVWNCVRDVNGAQLIGSRGSDGAGGSPSTKKLPCRSQGLAEKSK